MINENKVTFYELKWDTNYFGVTCAKAILHQPLKLIEWNDLKNKFSKYNFISIENQNSEPINAQFIAKDTKAFLIDVNIQFKKKIQDIHYINKHVKIYKNMKPNKKIIELAKFNISKFIEDGELLKRGGKNVYQNWIKNSFQKEDKYFAINQDSTGEINGFLLHSYSQKICKIELIAVEDNKRSCGIGTKLFNAIEYSALRQGCYEIKVGTQVRNIKAINFYHTIGCKQMGCHQVYHLWKLE